MSFIKKVVKLLTAHEKKRVLILLLLILVMSLLDMLGVASILPFIAVLTNPGVVETNDFLFYLYQKSKILNVKNTNDFLFLLGVSVFLLLIISLTFRAITTYAQIRFTLMREYSIGKRLIQGYLSQPYIWFLNRHSADISQSILSEVREVINKTIMPIMNILVHGAITIAFLTLLVFVDFKLAIISGLVLGLSYIFIFQIIKKKLSRYGAQRFQANTERFTAINEAFGAVKELKFSRLENFYIDRFKKPAELYAKSQSLESIISHLPRFLIEGIAFGGMILLILIMMATGNNFTKIIPIVAVYAFAGYRLIPALQQVYIAFTQLRFSEKALDSIYKDISNLKKNIYLDENLDPITLNKAITIKDLSFSYSNSEKKILKGINLSIPVSSKIGIVGSTGSGKTTLIDIILGLLDSNSGKLLVDDKLITNTNCVSWQKNIGYVPQDIFLIDESIKANIAFGVSPTDIKQEIIEKVAKKSNLHDFITKELPMGYETVIGEKGVRLSGGQRQRIGIARALYHNPKVLILDEATSALDNLTEQVLMQNLISENKDITIIMIAHRLSTIKNCNKIFLLEDGEIRSSGTFKELGLTDELFKKMSNTSN